MKSPFDVWIEPTCWIKLNEYAAAAQPTEIGGLARVRIDGSDVFVEDIAMIPQEATGVTFDITADDIQKFVLKLVQEGREDEMSQWCSIVHSHPVGMGASMSSTDVDAIMRFAEDQDAFSLIISTSHKADSLDLKMHYCANIRGRKVIFEDMPVNLCYNAERLEVGEKLGNNLAKHFGVADSPEDVKDIVTATKTFMASKMPHMFSKERRELRMQIEADVKTLITKPITKIGGGWRSASGYTAYGLGNGYTQKDEADWAEMEYEAGTDAGWNSGYGSSVITNALTNQLSTIEKLYKVAFLEPDAPKQRIKKATKAWERAVLKVNTELRKDGGIGIGDMVQLTKGHCKETPENKHMFEGMWEVEHAHGSFNVTMYVGGEAFFPEEMTLMVTFDEMLAKRKEMRRLEHEAREAAKVEVVA